ncbi:MAG: hypothetical protein ACK5YZ_00510 [bacterium]
MDGEFRPRSRYTLLACQRILATPPTGEVSTPEWAKLAKLLSFQTYGHIDMEDAATNLQKNPNLTLRHLLADSLRYGLIGGVELDIAGAHPHCVGGPSNAIEIMIRSVISASLQQTKLGLFRIFAHGGPGLPMIPAGRGGQPGGPDEARAALTAVLTRLLRSKFMTMASPFHPFASAEFHGCRVSANEPGRLMLKDLANAWRVPVTAGIQKQFVGNKQAFRFEGPTVTIYPNQLSLRQ